MEYDKKKILNIATGDTQIVAAVIERVNKAYKAGFSLNGSEEKDGVEFALVERGESTLDEIFILGYYYGAKVKELRGRKEIDW
ncbi:hypothetical protein N9B82_06780 [Saprospiraceae bacterium]|nr:hypothetical protein [Saprospiraceae bacterium]